MNSDEVIYTQEELTLLNRYFLRNRLRALEKPSQRAYIEKLIKHWGNAQLALSLQTSALGDLDLGLAKEVLWETKKYSDITALANCLSFDVNSKILSQGLPEIENLKSHLQEQELRNAASQLSRSFDLYFKSKHFEQKEIGMYISSLVMGRADPQRVIRYLERFLFGKSDKVGIVMKMRLLGKEKTAERIKLLEKVLSTQSLQTLEKQTS